MNKETSSIRDLTVAVTDFVVEARRFKQRARNKLKWLLILFIPPAVFLCRHFMGITGANEAIITANVFLFMGACAYANFMWRPPIKCFCGECGKYIPSDMEWQCGFCDTENKNTDYCSFLNKCQNCEKQPDAFQCPHCRTLIFIQNCVSIRNFAVKFGEPLVVDKEEQVKALQTSRLEQKEELTFEIEIAALNRQLAALKAENGQNKNGRWDGLRNDFEEEVGMAAEVERLYAEELEKAGSNPAYTSNPERLKNYRRALEHWRDKQII